MAIESAPDPDNCSICAVLASDGADEARILAAFAWGFLAALDYVNEGRKSSCCPRHDEAADLAVVSLVRLQVQGR